MAGVGIQRIGAPGPCARVNFGPIQESVGISVWYRWISSDQFFWRIGKAVHVAVWSALSSLEPQVVKDTRRRGDLDANDRIGRSRRKRDRA